MNVPRSTFKHYRVSYSLPWLGENSTVVDAIDEESAKRAARIKMRLIHGETIIITEVKPL